MVARVGLFLVAVAAMACCVAGPAQAQRSGEGATELELVGVVEGSYPNAEPTAGEALVRLGLTGVALRDPRGAMGGTRLPSPGEVVFVRVDTRLRAQMIPPTGATVRAVVRDAGRGMWAGRGAGWFRVESPRPSDDTDSEDEDDDDAAPLVQLRGLSCRAKIVQGQIGFEVVGVPDTGSAREAGLQPGDVIVAVNGRPLSSVAEFEKLGRDSRDLSLGVIDVNTGRLAEVALRSGAARGPRPGEAPAPPPTAAGVLAKTLGLTVEPVRMGLRGAVKVVAATAGQGGADAGLEPGDTIVEVNSQRVGTVEEFVAALPVGGGTVTLLVRDVRSERDVPIEAVASAIDDGDGLAVERPEIERPTGPPAGSPATGAADRFGLQTELAFYDAEAAVKIVGVKSGSAASRAGLRTGWIILRANDAPMLHPDDLTKAEAAAGSRLNLRVVDPATKRDSTVTLTL
jgi:S1-C subfamily serine protease